MLLANLGIVGGIYIGKQLFDWFFVKKTLEENQTTSTNPEATKDQPQDVTLLQKVIYSPDELNTSHIRYSQLSGLSIATVSAAYFFYPPLRIVNTILIAYTTVPILQRTLENLVNEGKVKNHAYTSLTTILLLITGNALAAGVNNLVYYLSVYLIQRSREDSARFATQVFQDAPESVWILTNKDVEKQILLTDVQVGDIVLVGTGEVIPVDGKIQQGMAFIDQQALTGEANPIECTEGDEVMASTVVLSGRIGIRANHSGEETRIDKLNSLLEQTESYKTQLQLKGEAWADKAAFPVMLSSAMTAPFLGVSPALALLFSLPANTVRSMLSMQTATHMQGIAKQGIFIKDGRVLEELPRIDTVLFDKTGTLTETRPEVARIIACADYTENELLTFAAAAEQRLDHPIAHAIVYQAEKQNLVLPTAEESSYDLGLGITVTIDGHEVRVGSQRFIQHTTHTEEQALPEVIATTMQEAQGHTFILVAIDGNIQGALELYPRLRPEAPELIEYLRQRECQLAIVSGDQQLPTERLAKRLDIDLAYGDVLPQDKAGLIEKLQAEGKRVCFVGDGLNDAIAMKQANVSVCLNSASAITSDMAHIVLLEDNLLLLREVFERACDLEKQLANGLNFWVGFGITNALAVPLLQFGAFQSSLLYGAAYGLGLWRNSDQGLVHNQKSKSPNTHPKKAQSLITQLSVETK